MTSFLLIFFNAELPAQKSYISFLRALAKMDKFCDLLFDRIGILLVHVTSLVMLEVHVH